MSTIHIEDLSFSYPTSGDAIFEHVTLQLDTSWKLGLVGRNGRGKTTLLRLLTGELAGSGTLVSPVSFDYFPFSITEDATALAVCRGIIAPFTQWEQRMETLLASPTPQNLEAYGDILEQYTAADGYTIDELIEAEISKLGVTPQALNRRFFSLSPGEQVKLQLASLFLKKHRFLLIDEPTNHLDEDGRRCLGDYLSKKSGFLLVSHDRDFLDRSCDHILSINRHSLELVTGNYSTWWENFQRHQQFEERRNQALRREIRHLSDAARATEGWSNQVEASKIGSYDKGYIGHKSAKMMKRAKVLQSRREKALEEASSLLSEQDIPPSLRLHLAPVPGKALLDVQDLTVKLGERVLFSHLSFCVSPGDRIALRGSNGTGKSTLLRLLSGDTSIPYTGSIRRNGGLLLSQVPQESAFLHGEMREFIRESQLEESLFKAILRKLDFSRQQFDKRLEELSAGQQKKLLVARSLCQRANLFLWDEPLNFLDVLSRTQLEQLLLSQEPTMIFVEHDRRFQQNVATREIIL